MKTKLASLKEAAAANDWRTALRIAAKFPRLGEHEVAIVRAHEAFTNASFAQQLGRDPNADIDAGIEALKVLYKLPASDDVDAVVVPAAKPKAKVAKTKAAPRKVAKAVAPTKVIAPVVEAVADVPAPAAPVAPVEIALPTPPDFTAPTHAGYRKRLGEVIALVEAGDIAALRSYPIKPASSSRRIMARYRDQAVIALEARA